MYISIILFLFSVRLDTEFTCALPVAIVWELFR